MGVRERLEPRWAGGGGEAGVGMLGGRRGRGGLLAAYLSIVAIFWNRIGSTLREHKCP